jgi:hypothetical protein
MMSSTPASWSTKMPLSKPIVQVAVANDGGRDVVYALCSDGTLWRLAVKHNITDWLQLPPVLEVVPGQLPDDTG